MTTPPPLQLTPLRPVRAIATERNGAFIELLGLLKESCEVTEDALVDALFMVRAHHSLEGIIPCCRYLSALARAFPGFELEPAFADQSSRLHLLREIGQLDVSRESYLGVYRLKHRHSLEHRPAGWVGDSGVCDLVIVSRPWLDLAEDPAHARILAWFAWQVMQHQSRNESRDAYRAYILGPGSPQLSAGLGQRIAAIQRSLRSLWRYGVSDQPRALASLCSPFSEKHSRELFDVLELALARHPGDQQGDLATGGPARRDPVVGKRNEMIGQLRASAPVGRYAPGVDLDALKRFLELVWFYFPTSQRLGGGRRRRIGLAAAPSVQRYYQTVAVTQAVNGDGVQDGVAIDLYDAPEPPPRVTSETAAGQRGKSEPARDPRGWTDDPVDELPVEPAVTLFLAGGDALSGWYATRSAAHHIERENAWLHWPAWRLSSEAIAALLAYVAQARGASPEIAWGRLALGLSLLTGRPVSSTSAVTFVKSGAVPDPGAIVIQSQQYLLVVPAGHPQLQLVAPATVQAYCSAHATTLRLPLPQAWTPLLDALRDVSPPGADVVVRAAKAALVGFPSELRVAERGVSGALKLALLQAGHGDLGLVKVVTDTGGINFNNIIHYASYARDDVERRWRGIVHDWAGPLHKAPGEDTTAEVVTAGMTRIGAAGAYARVAGASMSVTSPCVGTPYGIQVAKVAPHIAQLKQHIHDAAAAEDWAAVNNLLTLYVAVWLGLATAGRSALEPVPGIILVDGWALIRDKHRPDESTDRYVPLGRAIREQLGVLRSLTAALGLTHAEFVIPPAWSDHCLQLRLVQPDGQIVAFHPKDVAQSEALRDLPGNWGRKVVRSCAADLPGRFLDAGLGHWVRGRHPWTLTSTFPAAAFRRQWLVLQERLEQEMGFEVLVLAGLPAYVQRSRLPVPPRVVEDPAASMTSPASADAAAEDDEARTLLENCHGERWYDAVFKQQPAVPAAALDLANWAITHADGALGPNLADTAKRVCTYIRTQVHVPLFATRPRGRFQHNWLVNRNEFAALAYVERVLLPGIQPDLEHLPRRPPAQPVEPEPPPVPASATDPEQRAAKRRHWAWAQRAWRPQKLATGRLIAALALRGGLVNTTHLDTFLIVLAGDTPVLAVGSARCIELEVLSRRARDPVRRTVLLEPYLAALVTSERDGIRAWLQAAARGNADQRQAHWNAALHVYLRSLGLPVGITLAMFFAAVRQRIQLQASPVLAAYASGELLTQDLSLQEFARLAGCAMPAAYRGLFAASAKAALDGISGVGVSNPKRKKGQHGHVASLEPPSADAVGADVPDDVRAGPANLPARLCGFSSRFPREWLRAIELVGRTVKEPLERLLCAFAADLVHRYVGRGGHRDKVNENATSLYTARPGELALSTPRRPPRTYLSPRFKAWARVHLTIVWAGLTGFSSTLGSRRLLDEAVVLSLAESTEAYFRQRYHLAAWSRFRSYLMDAQADHAGFQVGEISGGRPRPVSARILSRTELERAAAYLGSVRSGLEATHTRSIASRHFALIRATGARRAEAAHLRWADVDGNCIRIRPYDGHTLKTPAAERIVPSGLLPRALWRELRSGPTGSAQCLIDLAENVHVGGDDFFDAEANAIKQGGGDDNLGPHHLRHTKANALLLKVLGNCVNLGLLTEDLPWVADLLPPDRELDVLLGGDGQCGQGLQAIAMLLGHLHPTTTLRHYLHTLGVALYAYQLGQPPISLQRAFADRMPGRATLYRRAGHVATAAQSARRVRDWIEAVAERAHAAGGMQTPLVVAAIPTHGSGESARPAEGSASSRRPARDSAPSLRSRDWTVAGLECWQRYFTHGEGAAPAGVDAMRAALRAIARIPSGKRGAHAPRHPLPVAGHEGLRLPAMIRSGSEATHAEQLLNWLKALERAQPRDYDWLLDKWLYASDASEGSLRLDSEAEVGRVHGLLHDGDVLLEVREAAVATGRNTARVVKGSRLRIRFGKSKRPVHKEPASQSSPYAGQTTRVVRWVLTWLAVQRGGVSAGSVHECAGAATRDAHDCARA